MAQDNISKLYSTLKDVYELGSEDDFRKYLSNGRNREALRKELESEYETGDSVAFTRYLGFDQKAEPQQAVKEAAPQADNTFTQAQLDSMEQAEAQNPLRQTLQAVRGTAQQIKQQAQSQSSQQTQRQTEQPAWANLWQRNAVAEGLQRQYEGQRALEEPMLGPTYPQQGYQPTQEEELRGLVASEQARQTAENVNAVNNRERQGMTINRISGKAGGNSKLRKGKPKFNAESGKFEDTWVTQRGEVYDRFEDADAAQRYDDEVGNTSSLNKQLEEAKAELARLREEYKNAISAESQEYKKKKAEDGSYTTKKGISFILNPVKSTMELGSTDSGKIKTAIGAVEDRIQTLENEINNPGFFGGLGQTLSDVSSFSAGAVDVFKLGALKSISDKLDKNEPLTDSELSLVGNVVAANEAEAMYGGNRGSWFKAGQTTGESLKIMLDFLIGSKGLGNLAKGGVKYATKKGVQYFGKEAMEKALTKYAVKTTGAIGGTLAFGTAMTNTVQAPKVAVGTGEKMLGTLIKDDKGNYVFADKESFLPALLHTEQEMIPENASEAFGEFIPGGKAFLKGMEKVGLSKMANGLTRLSGTKWYQNYSKLLRASGFNGLAGEGLEEYAGTLYSAILGDLDGIKSLADPDTHIDIWLGTLTTTALLNAPRVIGTTRQAALYQYYKRGTNRADREASALLTEERWNPLRERIDGTKNEDMKNLVVNILADQTMQTEEKKAALDYVKNLQRMRGYNLGLTAAMQGDGPSGGGDADDSQGQPVQQPRVADYNIKGNSVEELDENGNVIATHDYETRDEMKAGLFALQQERADRNMHADIDALRGLPDGNYSQLLLDYCSQNGMVSADFEAILNKPTMERTEDEQQLVTPFAKMVHDAVFDRSTIHEEQSAQDGEAAADADSIDMEEDSSEGIAIRDSWEAAKKAREDLFAKNETLRQEVESREAQGMNHADIVSSLETFTPEEVDTVIDYYNQKARYEGYMNRKSDNIDREARDSRERHTFKGTINGEADMRNVRTITDGTNQYFLVSGDVTTDSEGRITDSASGLIIGMDLDGSFVQLRNTDGYMVLPPSQSLDQFEEQERIRLQEQVSAIINPNAAEEAAVVQQPTEQNGGETGQPAEQTTQQPQQQTQQPSEQQPQVDIASVTDESGVKHYERGVGVDQAIDDMMADEVDVLSEADLAIGEAQAELAKLRTPKTRAERVQNDAKRKEQQGIVDYYTQLKQRYNERYPTYADAQPFIDQINAATSKKKADEVLNAALQAGVNPAEIQPVHTQKVSDIISKEEEARRQADEVTDKDRRDILEKGGTAEGRAWLLDRKRVPSAERRRKMAELIYGEYFDGDFEAIRSVEELISSWLGKGRELDPDTFGQELGWDMSIGKDAAKVSTMFAARRQNGGDGMPFNEFVHMVWENSGDRWDTQDIRNALIEMFRSAQEKSDLTEYQLQTRVAEAENLLQEDMRRAEEGAKEDKTDTDAAVADDDGMLPFAPMTDNSELDQSGLPSLSEGEDNENPDTTQEKGPEFSSREEYLSSHPLTEEQIMADSEATEDEKLNAIDFLRGEDDSAISRFYYDSIYERAATQSPQNTKKGVEEESSDVYELVKEALEGRDLQYASATYLMAKLQKKGVTISKKEADDLLQRYKQQNGASKPQKTQDQQDIDDALKEFNDFLDDAKGSSVLDKFMRKGLEGNDKAQASLLDAFTLTNEAQRKFLGDLLRLASKVGYAYIKSGVHDVQTWSKKMADGIGQKLKEVLGWDDDIIGEFVDEVWQQKYTVDGQRMRLSEHAERLKNGNSTDQTVNEHKNENNEPEKVVSSQQKPASELEGDSAEFAERQAKIDNLTKRIAVALEGVVFRDEARLTLANIKAMAKKEGVDSISDTDLQELVEAEIVQLARDIANTSALNEEQKFRNIVKLYENQPSLNARDNDRINKQQYSTPAPMAFLMGKFLTDGKPLKTWGLEPSAGNGMLTIGLPKEKMHVNDIDEMRLSNLQKQGFGQVTSQDGLQPFESKAYDVVVTNPPFGNVPAKTYDGLYEISGLEHQMAINALESMSDGGRAAIIIGGNTEYNPNGTIKGKDRAFLNYLYAHYNVVDVINMDGKTLYSRQGTGFPVRMILISGRKAFDQNSFAPVQSKARAEQVNSYDELYKRVNDDILSNGNESAGVHDTESGESNGKHDNGHAGDATQTGVRNVRTEGGSGQSGTGTQSGPGVQRGNSTPTRSTQEPTNTSMGEGLSNVGGGPTTSQSGGSGTQQTGGQRNELGRDDAERPSAATDNSVGVGQRGSGTTQQDNGTAVIQQSTEQKTEVKRGLGTEKVPYRKQSSNPFTLQSLMPAEQADVVKKALEDLGDVDQFLVDELGYSSKEELHQALAAEQIDSVAMAIHQMNQGSAFIIGDQTGIGKGRQAAALIRYGVKKGGFPVFITVKKALFSDMYRDLCDIGSPGLRPFIWSAGDTEKSANVTDKDGNVVYERPSDKEQKRVIEYINKNGKLPPEYDYVLTTYDSFKSGTMDYENGAKKPRSFGKKQPSAVHYNGQAKRDALETLAGNSFVIMDESHNAGGEGSNVSNYLQYITTKAKGLTFLSATFAKRPGNMPIYSLKTAIAKAGVKVDELIDAVKRGGATFQEIMSKALTEAGQMIRRERDMTGVTIDWKGIEDEAVIQQQREQYDKIIGLFNDIIDFQRRYVDPIVNKMNDDAAEEQGEVDHTPGTRDMGINNTPFASRTYNMVQQVLLSLKAEEAAKRAIEHLKAGRKPVITVANTNEGAADEAAGMSDEAMEMPDLSVNLKKGLMGTLRITKKDAFGNSTNSMIPFERLSEEGRARYAEIMDAIENASSGLSLSPIDVIKNELQKAGYKVGELTGRKAEFVYNEDGTVKRVKRQDTDKKRIAADFNNGKLDALILNRSAGTGISLHASSKFKDQRQRIMIVAQAQGDVNDEVQIRGRIDRTGQVLRGMYEYVVSQIPSEQRLLMMLKAKLRSLDANTTSSQKSKFNEMQVQDIINKYGDDIVIQYLAEHPDLYAKMADPLGWGDSVFDLSPESLISSANKANGGDGATASKVLGRMALLKVAEQEKMLQEIGDMYQAEIDRLNEMGENDLEITEMPLRAKTLRKSVWEEGTEPGGKNPFADNSYVEEVEMDVLRKPMKAEEVKKSQARLLGGKTWDEYKQEQLDKVDKWAETKRDETRKTFTERAEKKAKAEKERYIKGAKKAQEKNGMTDEEIEKNGQYQYDNVYKEEMDKLKNAVDAVDKQKQVFVDALETFSTDGVFALPTDLYDLSQLTFEPSFGKLIDIKISDNYSTAASTITFATLDGRRKITIPISGMVKQQNDVKVNVFPKIVQQTAQARSGMFGSNVSNTMKVLEQNVDNWDRLTSTATRKKGYIITGNLLKALTSLRSQGQGGKLISYTTDTGEIRQGILMGEHFDPKGLTSKTPISSAKDDLHDWQKGNKIVSADGEVTVKNENYGWYKLKVPKSKKKGEKYFNDEVLLSLMDGQFSGTTQMAADFQGKNLDAVLKRLDELGVTVESANEDTGIEETVTSADPMEAISRAADRFRSEREESESVLNLASEGGASDGNSVSLRRRMLRSYTDRYGRYHKGIEEELGELEAAISEEIFGERGAGAGTEATTTGAIREGGEVSGDGDSSLLHPERRVPRPGGRGGASRLSDLRRRAAELRAEKARREQNWQEMRQKYHISEKGDATLADLRRMFHDLNGDKALDELFEKVYDVLKDLNVTFRFSDKIDPHLQGEAEVGVSITFYNRDSFVNDQTDQTKATVLLHEMIHHVAAQIIMRYEDPQKRDTLTTKQKKVAEDILSIYEQVKKAYPKRNDYGLTSVHEMLSEIANPEFRELLSRVPYQKGGTNLWEKLKNAIRRLLGISALDRLNKDLDRLLSTYDASAKADFRRIREEKEKDAFDDGLIQNSDEFMDLVERTMYDDVDSHASLVEDEDLIDELERGDKVTVYRAMQVQNGKLYPPMAAKVNGKWQDPLPLGQWSQADEHPELVNKNGKFDLDKGNGKKVAGVVYAPYMHGSTTMLNDQFKEAQDRPELVVVEAEMPSSELTSGYQAEKSHRKTGMLDWKAGTIQGQLTGTRQVMLSRWVKPVRIVPSSEVAQNIKQMIDGQVEVMPTNVVTPEQRAELEKLGVKFVKTDNKEIIQEGEHKGEQYSDAYGAKSKKTAIKSQGKKRRANAKEDPMESILDAANRFRRERDEEAGNTPLQQSEKELYETNLDTVTTVATEAWVDSMVSLKHGQEAIAHSKDIPDSQNAYMQENLMHGKNKNEQDLFNGQLRDPLIDTINKIISATGMNWGDIDRYVYTKHGLERNREFYVRDWLEKERNATIGRYEDLNAAEQDIYDQMAARIEEDFEDGTIESEEKRDKALEKALQQAHQQYIDELEERWIDLKQRNYDRLQAGDIDFNGYLAGLDSFIRENIDGDYVSNEHDYSGFRAMYGDEEGNYDEDAIITELMKTEETIDETPDGEPSGMVAKLWGQINAATRYGLERYREAGMRSDEQIDRTEQMFHWFVPLRGFKEAKGEDMYQYFSGKGNPKEYVGGLLRHAKGRGSEANYPLSTIFSLSYQAIADCNRNLVNQHFYRLCQAHPNDLVVLSDSWVRLNEDTGEWVEDAPKLKDGMSAEEIRQATLAWEEEMRQLAMDGKAKKLRGKEHFAYKPLSKENRDEHYVDVYVNGQRKRMVVTGNPRMAQALNGQLRYSDSDGIMSKSKVTRRIQNMNKSVLRMRQAFSTNYSLSFVWRNAMRDWTHFSFLLSAKEGAGYTKAAEKYYFENLFGMRKLFKKYREGTLDESNEKERDFKDFMDNGGVTGFVQMQKVDDIEKEMQKLTEKIKKGGVVELNDAFWKRVATVIEAYNEAIENRARFATYRASRHYAHRTRARSAYDAKEVTANFNRKGAGKKTAGFNSQNERVMLAATLAGRSSQVLNANKMFFNATIQGIATLGSGLQRAEGQSIAAYAGKQLTKRMVKYGWLAFALASVMPLVNEALIAAFGSDDDDDPYANLPEWVRRKNLCIYVGGGKFVTIALGQELAAFYSLGDMTAGQTYAPELRPVGKSTKDEIVGFLTVFSPLDIETKMTNDKKGTLESAFPEVVGRVYSNATPFINLAENISWTGRPIYKEDRFPNDEFIPEYQRVYNGTGGVWIALSKGLNDLTGGDDVTRGKRQVNPALLEYLVEQYFGGVGRFFTNTGDVVGDAIDAIRGEESDFNVRKIEGVRSLIQQSDDRTRYYRSQEKYRKYKKDADELKSRINRYKKDMKENPEHKLKYEELTKGVDYARMELIQKANKNKKGWKVGLDTQYKKAMELTGVDRKEALQHYYNDMVALVQELDSLPMKHEQQAK